jgi:hypothetical protein
MPLYHLQATSLRHLATIVTCKQTCHHNHVTHSRHSFNAIGHTPHCRKGGKREKCSMTQTLHVELPLGAVQHCLSATCRQQSCRITTASCSLCCKQVLPDASATGCLSAASTHLLREWTSPADTSLRSAPSQPGPHLSWQAHWGHQLGPIAAHDCQGLH